MLCLQLKQSLIIIHQVVSVVNLCALDMAKAFDKVHTAGI